MDFTFQKNKVMIIAELSSNHNQDLGIALETIEKIADSGADAVKFQTFRPESLSLDCENEYFGTIKDGLWKGYKPFDLYKEAQTPYEWHEQLFGKAREVGLLCLSSPFDIHAVDFLEGFNPAAYKVASPEITDVNLIKHIASKKRPVIMSTGVADENDIHLALETCRSAGNNDLILLKCTTAYPTPYHEMNLNAIPLMAEKFDVKIGLSDHSLGATAAIAAVALGASVIEKHFILNKAMGSLDSEFSMAPEEFKNMVRHIRILEKALGNPTLGLSKSQIKSKKGERSLFVAENIKKGEVFSKTNIRSVRPGYGLHPKYLDSVLGKTALVNLSKGTPLDWNCID